MQVKVDGKRNITLDFEAPKKFKLLQDGKEIPYLRTGKNSFRLLRNIDGVLDLEEIIEQPKIVKPMQLQAQQMALVNPNDVLMINQAAQQLEAEQNILGETQKRVEQTQAYLDVQQQRINETVLSVQGLETDNAERITATENGLFNLAGNLATTEQNLIDSIGIVNNGLQEHKSAENPHRITKKTIGLDKVDNTSDIDKPISKAVQNALDEKADKDEIQAIREELGEYQEKNDRFTNALSNYTGGLAYSGSDITIDDMLSTESENPVQNKVITNALNEKADISDIPTVNNATLTIQKNGTSAGAFSANASEDVNINLIIPTTASDVFALPDSTKYGAGLSLTINSTNYVMTAQLKDQDGNNLGTAQTIDLPLESVVVSGSYDSANKKIVLTLQNGTTIDIPVGDLISGLQTEITENNKLDADLVDDSTSINKFVTASDITTWNGKQDTISDLATIRSNATAGKSASDTIATYGDIVTHNVSEFATSAQGALADSALQSGDNITELTNNAGYITGITSSDVITALGYTPYNSSNPSGYQANVIETVKVNGTVLTPTNKEVDISVPSAVTEATVSGWGFTKNAGTVTSVNNTSPDGNGNVTLSIPAAQVNSDWNANSGVAEILNKPTIPTVNNSTITLTQGGVTKGTFTLNQSSGANIDFDAGGGGAVDSVNGQTGAVVLTASDVGAVDLTLDQTITGIKTATDHLNIKKSMSGSAGGYLDIIDADDATKSASLRHYVTDDGTNYARLQSNAYNAIAYTDVRVLSDGTRVFACSPGCDVAYAPASTATNSIVTTTGRSVGASSVKFGFGNGLKIATKEVSLTAATDYSWSYGITFSAAPVILVTRRSGATSTGGVYDAWVRGSAGTSSSKIYCPSAITVELVAIGY